MVTIPIRSVAFRLQSEGAGRAVPPCEPPAHDAPVGRPPGSARFPPAAIDTLEAGLHMIRDTAWAILICLVMTFAFLYMALGFFRS